MEKHRSAVAIAALTLCAAAPAAAQQGGASARADVILKQQRYQIGQMERVLEGAVEHGATMMRDRLQAVVPPAQAQLLIQENAHARGFRLEGYGVFFDVIVPSLDGSLTWSLRTLDQNDLGLQSALAFLKTRINPTDIDMQQALKRIELQVGSAAVMGNLAQVGPAAFSGDLSVVLPPGGVAQAGSVPVSTQAEVRSVTGAAAGVDDRSSVPAAAQSVVPAAQSSDPILDDPNEAYRGEVIQALTDAMLDHSSALGVGPNEWVTIAARRNEELRRLAPDSGAQTIVIRLSGTDLAAFRAGQLSREEAFKRVERRVF